MAVINLAGFAKDKIIANHGNWDIYTAKDGSSFQTLSISKDGNPDGHAPMGNKDYLVRLLKQNDFNMEITEKGLEYFEGLHSRPIGKGWGFLAFAIKD